MGFRGYGLDSAPEFLTLDPELYILTYLASLIFRFSGAKKSKAKIKQHLFNYYNVLLVLNARPPTQLDLEGLGI